MNVACFYRVELGRLLRSRVTWLILLLTVCAAALPLLLEMSPYGTRFMNYIGIANQSGSLGGGVLFALLSLFELSKMHTKRADRVIEAIASPQTLYVARVLALLTAGAIAALLTALLLLPYGLITMADIFEPVFYIQSFTLLMLCAILLSVLLACSLYAILRKVSVSFILYLLLGLAPTVGQLFYGNYFVQWLIPSFTALSDVFGNDVILRLYAYNRLIWFCILTGLFLVSVLCVRRYGKGLLGSLRAHMHTRQCTALALAAVLIASGASAYVREPFYDNSPPYQYDVTYSDDTEEGEEADDSGTVVAASDGFAVFYGAENEQPTDLLLMGTELTVDIQASQGSLSGTAVHTVQNRTDHAVETTLSLNPGYSVERILIDGAPAAFEDLHNDSGGAREIAFSVPVGDKAQTVTVDYAGVYKMSAEFQGYVEGSRGIFDRYIALGASTLFPYMEIDCTQDVRTSGTITMPEEFVLVADGATNTVMAQGDGTKTWWVDNKDASIRFEAGAYVKKTMQAGGIQIEFYYHRKHEAMMEEIGAADMVADVIEYCTELFGPLPYDESVPFKLIECTALVSGGYAKNNISVMDESVFSAENLADPDKGASAREVLAHEIIHQWWGITAMCYDMEDTWWTNEGITTFNTYLYVRERYGEAYANEHYLAHWEAAVDDMLDNFYFRYPDYQQILPEEYSASLAGTYSAVQMYSMTALIIYRAGECIGMDQLKQVMTELYQTGGAYLPPFVTFQDFLDATGLEREEIAIV